MVHREAEKIAIGLRSDRRYPPRVRQQTDFAEVRSVRQRGRDFAVRHYDIDYAFLYEVHFRADSTLLNDDITCKINSHSNDTYGSLSDAQGNTFPCRDANKRDVLHVCMCAIENALLRDSDNRYLAGRLRI